MSCPLGRANYCTETLRRPKSVGESASTGFWDRMTTVSRVASIAVSDCMTSPSVAYDSKSLLVSKAIVTPSVLILLT